MFLGTHTPRLDEKGRLFLPAKYREELAAGLVITKGQERCLYVFPVPEFARITDALRDAPVTAKNVRDYSRVFFASASDEVPDKQGRITIPPALRADGDLAEYTTDRTLPAGSGAGRGTHGERGRDGHGGGRASAGHGRRGPRPVRAGSRAARRDPGGRDAGPRRPRPGTAGRAPRTRADRGGHRRAGDRGVPPPARAVRRPGDAGARPQRRDPRAAVQPRRPAGSGRPVRPGRVLPAAG